jgi:hypothetical protein
MHFCAGAGGYAPESVHPQFCLSAQEAVRRPPRGDVGAEDMSDTATDERLKGCDALCLVPLVSLLWKLACSAKDPASENLASRVHVPPFQSELPEHVQQ